MLYRVSKHTKLTKCGFITLFYTDDENNVVGKRFVGDFETNYTLQDCYYIAKLNGFNHSGHGCLKVLDEGMLHGNVYVYGNHGDFWEKVGEVAGLA